MQKPRFGKTNPSRLEALLQARSEVVDELDHGVGGLLVSGLRTHGSWRKAAGHEHAVCICIWEIDASHPKTWSTIESRGL